MMRGKLQLLYDINKLPISNNFFITYLFPFKGFRESDRPAYVPL